MANAKNKNAPLNLMRAGIVFCTFLMLGYPLLLERELIGYFVTRYVVAILGIVMALYVSEISYENKELERALSKLRVYLWGYIPIVAITALWTMVRYNYTFENVLMVLTPYAYIFLAYPLIYIFMHDGGPSRILKVVAVLIVGILCLKAYSWYCYNYAGEVVFERLLFEYDEWFRGGFQRVNAGFLVGVLLAVSLSGLLSKKKPLQLAAIVGLIIYLAVVSAYRYQLLVAIAVCILTLYLTSNRSGSGILLRMVIVVAVVLIITSEFSQSFFETFSGQSAMSQSTQVRIDNVLHYWDIIVNEGALFGLGLLNSGNPVAASYMTYFGNHVYWLEDIGVLGEFFRFGLLSLWTYGYFFYLAVATSRQSLQESRGSSLSILVVALASYALLSCLAMNIFDGQRAFDVPFYLAVFSYAAGSAMSRGEKGPISSASRTRFKTAGLRS